jgi:maltose O-acetyltransferase
MVTCEISSMDVLLYIGLKWRHFMLTRAAGNPDRVERSLGFEGIVRLLERLDGDDALKLLRSLHATIGDGVRWSRGIVLHADRESVAKLRVGSHCHLGREVFMDLADLITIGARVTLAMRSMVLTHTDPGDSRCGIGKRRRPVVVGDDTYVGAGAIILPGVTIGACSVVGAGAVVARDVPAGSVVAGVPARPVRSSDAL